MDEIKENKTEKADADTPQTEKKLQAVKEKAESAAAAPPASPAKPLKLFPSGERLRELSRLYEKESPKNEIGKTLALNTSELKYQKYLLDMKRKIETYWEYPFHSARKGEQGKLRIDFTIAKDGKVKNIKIIKSSNYPSLDDAAVTAIKLASPFNPFPADFTLEGIDIRASFEYELILSNIR